MRGYYSVFNPDGKKIADCGAERDALFLIHSRNKTWDGHYYTFNPLPGDIIDVNTSYQLPTTDIVVNMVLNHEGAWGFNFLTDEPVNMLSAGIIDPVKVTRCALQNAVSVASTLITTSHAIVS